MAVEWLDITRRCYNWRDIYMKKKIQLSRYCFYFSGVSEKYDRVAEAIGKKRIVPAESDDRNRAPLDAILFESAAERTDDAPYHLHAPFTYFKTRRWKNVCYIATVRSDLFYWDVGTSDQFTKCPVEHGGPVIVSMIRTSFQAPIRRTRTL